jgi:hypothetical protein
MLTSQRCLLLGHPKPLHRDLLWEVELEAVHKLEVVEDAEGGVSDRFARDTLAGGLKIPGAGHGDLTSGQPLDPRLMVQLNDVTIYVGSADRCGEIQAAIDEARGRRCITLFGHIKPYGETT